MMSPEPTTSNEKNKQVPMPVSHRVTMPSHFPMSHAAILTRRHPLQIPPPQFRGSCQCVGSLFSYKSLSLLAPGDTGTEWRDYILFGYLCVFDQDACMCSSTREMEGGEPSEQRDDCEYEDAM